MIVTKVDKGECHLGFRVEFKVFEGDVVDERQVHRQERGDGYCFLGEI